MTYDDAIALVQSWPKDRSVPRKLAEAIADSTGKNALMLGLLVEALTTAAVSEEDYKLIDKYFE